jgi:hypothetical protein
VSVAKVLGFLVVGVVVVAVAAVVLGMIASLLHVLIPVAALCVVGFVAVKAYTLINAPSAPKKDEPKKLEEQNAAAPVEAKKGLSEAEALAEFEAHRKKLGP